MKTNLSIVLRLSVLAVLALAPAAALAQAKGKISRNYYRNPYQDGTSVTCGRDYIDHGNTPAGNFGSMDMTAPGSPQIVAAAAGTVIGVNDSRPECGCDGAYGGCANTVTIQHANGEYSRYLHIQQNSATNAGIFLNTVVTAGQVIGIEGDVGWTCGSGRAANTGACVTTVPSGAGNCGQHLHWEVRRTGSNEYVNPMTCGISNSIYVDNGVYTAGDCTTAGCATNTTVPNQALSGFGTFRVYQADDTVTCNVTTVASQASLVLHAGERVVCTPGFRASPNSYFRAEIGLCNTTAVTPSQP